VPGNIAACWKTIPTRQRISVTGRVVMSVPLKNTLPGGGSSSRFRQRSSELLPLPLGPISMKTSPFSMASDTSRSTGLPPRDRVRWRTSTTDITRSSLDEFARQNEHARPNGLG